MARKNGKARKSYPRAFNKSHVAKILGIKPQNLTSYGGYVRTREIKPSRLTEI